MDADLRQDHDESTLPKAPAGDAPVTASVISGDGSLAKEVVKRIEDTEAGNAPAIVSPLSSHPTEAKSSAGSAPSVEADPEPKEQPVTEPKPVSEGATDSADNQPKASTDTAPKPPAEPAPLHDRIALPSKAIQPTTETTVTGGVQTATSPSREKDGSKVSSWLKSKLGRRSSKAAATGAPEGSTTKPTISAPKDPKVFIGAANLGAPDPHPERESSDAADSSMRAVALAGRNAGPGDPSATAPAADAAGATNPASKGKHPAAADDGDSDSTSISSLSSDEDTRGRSNTRLADHIEANKLRTQQQDKQHTAAPATTEQQDFATAKKDNPAPAAAATSGDRGTSSEEFVEARDQLELEPPDKSILGRKSGEGKKSDSPVRDSKFVEQL